MKIRHSVLFDLFLTSAANVFLVSTFAWQSSPAKASHPCPPFHRAEHIRPFGVPVCIPNNPGGNIPTNPRELSEEAWGQAGQAVYRQGSDAMLARASARGSVPRPLDEYQKRYLRPHFGNLVDNVVLFYNVPPLDDWQILGLTINNSHTDAQTFCERIFVNGQYNSTNSTQLVLLAHELVHSQQCQRFGGIERFGYEYFKAYKRANLNYDNISLEREAYAFDARFKEWLNAQLSPTVQPLTPVVSGSRLIQMGSGRCLTTPDLASNPKGANTFLYDCYSASGTGYNQRWKLQQEGDSYRLVQTSSGRCLTTPDLASNPNGANNGANAFLYDCYNASGTGYNQRWKLQQEGEFVRLVQVGSGRCLTTPDLASNPNGGNNGANIFLYDCYSASGTGYNQRWAVKN